MLDALEASAEDEIRLSFVGDISIGDSLSTRKHKTSLTSVVADKDDDWLFSTVRDFFEADDYSLGNLEVVLSDNDQPLYPLKTFNLIGPTSHVRFLQESGIDALNTVNNHCIDFKYAGYESTLRALESIGMEHFGTLNPRRQTNRYVDLLEVELKGIKFGFTGFSYPSKDMDLILADIQTLRADGCDVVVVSLHWGTEEQFRPKAGQYTFAKQIIDGGADVVWGHHPHVAQPVYFYKGKPILFSTGNFIFGTIKDLDPATGIFQLTWKKKADGSAALSSLRIVPINMTRNGEYRPTVLTDPDAIAKCLKHFMGEPRKEFTELPAGFEKTGTVEIR